MLFEDIHQSNVAKAFTMENTSPLPSPSMTSSPSHADDGPQPDGKPPPSGRVPQHQSIASASSLPRSSFREPSPRQIASTRYVSQFQVLMDHQRQTFNEERALWQIERSDLYEKITQLEATLRRYQSVSSSQLSSPADKKEPGSGSSFWSLLSTDGSRNTSEDTSGDEVWRGPKNDLRPSRTFSEISNQSKKSGERLPSIAEDVNARGRRKPSSTKHQAHQDASRKPSIHGSQIDKNLDGIHFKSSGVAPAAAKNIMTPQSPSPPQPPSPVHTSLGTIPLPPSDTVHDDLYTKDAGHTPLARRHPGNVDGSSSEGTSEIVTPTQVEQERPPLEPRASAMKLPSERADSYFPIPEEGQAGDEDPELSGPLSLKNDSSEDNGFLNELDSKLVQAAQLRTHELKSEIAEDVKEDQVDEGGKDFEQPEPEPKLRIKRSMNFGSQLGSPSIGKRFQPFSEGS